jgi:hypothetical protein
MPPDPPGPDSTESSPVLGLLSRGLEFWVRQQCRAIENLEIRLEGTALQLLRGRLAAVSLRARGVIYQELELKEVELRGEEMRVRMGKLLRQQSLELETAFLVRGKIRFSSEGLNRSLAHPNWSWLGDQLAEDLLGIRPLEVLSIQGDQLILQASSGGAGHTRVQRAVALEAREGTVELKSIDHDQVCRLPLDPAIRLEWAEVGCGHLDLGGVGTIAP